MRDRNNKEYLNGIVNGVIHRDTLGNAGPLWLLLCTNRWTITPHVTDKKVSCPECLRILRNG